LTTALKIGYTIAVATKDPFEINLADLDEIRAKIPEVEQIVEQRREVVSAAQRDFAYWQSILDRLRLVAGQKTIAKTGTAKARATVGVVSTGSESALDRIVRVLNESAIPLRADDVSTRLEKPMAEKTIRWALWKASKEERIQKLETGLYASLDYVSSNGSQARLDET
jgi:hypothetical protein